MRKGIRMGMIVVCVMVMAYAGIKLLGFGREYGEGTAVYDRIEKEAVAVQFAAAAEKTDSEAQTEDAEEPVAEETGESIPQVDFDALRAKYPEVVGWIYGQEGKISYPIVQHEDNDYYLDHMVDGTRNGAGAIFMDFRDAADFSGYHTRIYGHNMRNGSMFGHLDDYEENGYYETHKLFWILTPEAEYALELIGGYTTASDSYAYAQAENVQQRDELAAMARALSCFESQVFVEGEDKLVTLSTCTYDYDDARFVLVGVLREITAQ